MPQMKMRMLRITNAANSIRIAHYECAHPNNSRHSDTIRDSWHSSAIRRFGLDFFLTFVFSYIPMFAFADLATPKNLTEFVNNFITILNPVIAFVASIGFFVLLTGVLKYVGAGGDEERLGKAKQLIIYGLIGMLVIFSFWGIAKLLAKTYIGV